MRSLAELEESVQLALRSGNLDQSLGRILLRALHFPQAIAEDVMVPRTELDALPATATVKRLFELAGATRHARYLVHNGDLDDVRGIVDLNDAARLPERTWSSTELAGICRPALAVPTMAPLTTVIGQLRREPTGMALVVGEYGGTAGLITMHDVLEKVVGEVDAPGGRLRQLRAPLRGYIVPGGIRGEVLEEELNLRLPQGEYETVAGHVMDRLGRLAEVGDEVAVGGWTLRVHQVEGNRVASLLALPPPAPTGRVGNGWRREQGPSAAQLAAIVDASLRERTLQDEDVAMFRAALSLRRLDAGRAMVPRERISCVDRSASREEIGRTWLRHGHPRLPVHSGGIDSVQGYVFAPEVRRWTGGWGDHIPEALLHPVLRTVRTRTLIDVLDDMRRTESSVAIITGPRGATVGMLKLDDVLVQLLFQS